MLMNWENSNEIDVKELKQFFVILVLMSLIMVAFFDLLSVL
jgi:hypothetical protein